MAPCGSGDRNVWCFTAPESHNSVTAMIALEETLPIVWYYRVRQRCKANEGTVDSIRRVMIDRVE